MLQCDKCRTPLSEGSQYCSMCGTKVSSKNYACRKCGHLLNVGAKFCGYCGCSQNRLDRYNNDLTQSKYNNINHSFFVQARCENCGANLTIESTQNKVFCSSCGTPYVIPSRPSPEFNSSNESSDYIIESGELKSYKGSSPNIVIPSGVTCIGEGVFQNTFITSVILPNTLLYIKSKAFASCHMLREIEIPSSTETIEWDAFYSNPGLKIIWPKSWEARKESRLLVAAELKKRDIYFLCDDPKKIKSEQTKTLYYCGRGSENPFYFFCESSHFASSNTRRDSIFDFFYDIESLNKNDMYSDLAELFDMASINRSEIGTVEVPFYGWKSRKEFPDSVKNGKIQLFTIQLTVDYGWDDYENPYSEPIY